jgi:hypothetical protein
MEILHLPFLTSDTGTPVVDLQSPFWNDSLEGLTPINHPAGLPFGSSVQTNFTVNNLRVTICSRKIDIEILVAKLLLFMSHGTIFLMFTTGQHKWLHFIWCILKLQ